MSRETAEVDAYLADLPPERRAWLQELRAVVFEVVPDATETMGYRMPTYELDGKPFCAFASQKRYVSLYVMDTDLLDRYRDAFEGLNLGKSCVRFRRFDDLPLEIVKRMLREAVQGGGPG